QVAEVLRDHVLVRSYAELLLNHVEGLRARSGLELPEDRQRRVARHQPRQHEVQRQRRPQGQQEEAEAAQREPHGLLLSVIGAISLTVGHRRRLRKGQWSGPLGRSWAGAAHEPGARRLSPPAGPGPWGARSRHGRPTASRFVLYFLGVRCNITWAQSG